MNNSFEVTGLKVLDDFKKVPANDTIQIYSF